MRNRNFYLTILFCLTFSITSFAGDNNTPMNNECAGAALLTVGTECVPVPFVFDNATTSAISCIGGTNAGGNDVWFKVVAPASGNISFEWNNSELIGGVFSSSDGTCDNLSPISCTNSNGRVIVTGVPAGDMIFLQLHMPSLPVDLITIEVENFMPMICAFDPGAITPFTEFNNCFSAPKIDISPAISDEFVCYAFNQPTTIAVDNLFNMTGCGNLATVFKTIGRMFNNRWIKYKGWQSRNFKYDLNRLPRFE